MADENVKPKTCSWIDGVGSSEAIDTTGEIVSLAGIDCSSLIGGAFNWEHKSDVPAQIVGKILEYKKIFSEKDCEKDRHKYYWDKTKTPFLYVMGRLFDDKKPSAVECAALFQDDAEHPDEHPMVGLSIEGSKVSKSGIVVDKSIARKMTITGANANKQCVAELIPGPEAKSTDTDSIFKSEASHTIELLEPMNKAEPSKIPGQSRWKGKVAQGKRGKEVHLSHPKHGLVTVMHNKDTNNFEVKHHGTYAGIGGKKGVFGNAKDAMGHAKNYMQALDSGKALAPQMHNVPSGEMQGKAPSDKMNKALTRDKYGPATTTGHEKGVHTGVEFRETDKKMAGRSDTGAHLEDVKNPHLPKDIRSDAAKYAKEGHKKVLGELKQMPKPNLPKSEKDGNLKKAMTAGSSMCGPGSLVQAAALGKEEVDKKMKKTEPLEKAKVDEGKSPAEKAVSRNQRNIRTVTDTFTTHPSKIGTFFGAKPKVEVVTRTGAPGSPRTASPGRKEASHPETPSFTHSKKVVGVPAKSMKRSKWLARAEETYKTWAKREQFENFMAKHMPGLAKHEIIAIGQTLALRKSLRAEKKLSKLMARESEHSWLDRSEKK